MINSRPDESVKWGRIAWSLHKKHTRDKMGKEKIYNLRMFITRLQMDKLASASAALLHTHHYKSSGKLSPKAISRNINHELRGNVRRGQSTNQLRQ